MPPDCRRWKCGAIMRPRIAEAGRLHTGDGQSGWAQGGEADALPKPLAGVDHCRREAEAGDLQRAARQIEAWPNPDSKNLAAMDVILEDRQHTHYETSLVA